MTRNLSKFYRFSLCCVKMAVALWSCTVVSSTLIFRSSSPKSRNVGQKKQSKDERRNLVKPQPASYESVGIPTKDKDSFFDSNDHEVEPSNIQDTAFLNAVVKIYCIQTFPDYAHPWQKQRQFRSTASAFMIGGRKLLTSAHCVEDDTQVKVRRRGDATKYVAKVLARGVDCDIALLSVKSEEFWRDVEPLRFGRLPHLQDSVTVVGYPLGGDTISVTKGVVSRIEVRRYGHGSSELLGIQIDAAINPGNRGGPAFNDQGECTGVALQAYRSKTAENIGYVIPTTVVSHFLTDYEKNGRCTGFVWLGVLVQKLENPALRACLKVTTNEGVLVRRVEPTSDANNVLKEGDVIVSFDDVHIGCEGTVPFRSNEQIPFHYLVSQKFAGDTAELGIVRAGALIKVKVVLYPRVHLVPYHKPSYLIIAGFVFTPLSVPLIEQESEESIGLKLLAKARYSMARFKGEQIVILSQVLANKVNIGYENMSNLQVLKFNGTRIKNIHHLAHLADSCKERFLYFEFDESYVAVLERVDVAAASSCILRDYGIPSIRSDDLWKPYVDSLVGDQSADPEFGDSPVSNHEISFEGLLWA